MNIVQKIFSGILGIIGLSWLFQGSTVGGIIIIISAIIVLPKVLSKILGLFGKEKKTLLNAGIKSALIFLGLTIGFISASFDNSKADKIIEKAEKAIENSDLIKASSYIAEAKRTYRIPENKALELESMIDSLKSISFLENQMLSLSEKEFQNLIEGNLKKDFIENSSLNDMFVTKLIDSSDKKSTYANKKLEEIAKGNLKSLAKQIIINLSDTEYKKLKAKRLDTILIKKFPLVNTLLIKKLEREAINRNTYIKEKLDEIANYDKKKYMMNILGNLSASEYSLLKKGQLDTNFTKITSVNKYLLSELKKNKNLRKEYQKKQEKLKRNKQILAQFSSWDGSHYNLEKLIEQNMKDPDSYEHVRTEYWDKGSYLIVKTTYRGKNSFGAKVINSTTARVSLDGRVLKIIRQN